MDDTKILPFVIAFKLWGLDDDGVGLQLTYTTSKERHEKRQWDTAVFGLPIEIAKSLATAFSARNGIAPVCAFSPTAALRETRPFMLHRG